MKKLLIIPVLLLSSSLFAQSWYFFDDSLNASSYPEYPSVVRYMKTIGDTLFIDGSFDYAFGISTRALIGWNGSQWIEFDDGTYDGIYANSVSDIVLYKGLYFFGGEFPNFFCENFMFWDGVHWGAPTDFPNADVTEIQEFNGLLYVAGGFGYIGTTLMPLFAAFDGGNWINITKPSDHIQALEVYDGELYAGGWFTYFVPNQAYCIARNPGGPWWYPVGQGFDCYVNALAVDTFNNFLYAGGCMDYAYNDDGSAISIDGVAMWDGFKWNRVGYGNGVQWEINEDALVVYRGDLYAGLTTCNMADSTGMFLYRWDGNDWHGMECNSLVTALAVFQDTLFVGGHFDTVANVYNPSGLAKWFMPGTGCNYIKPLVYSLENGALQDTFNLVAGQAQVQFYNNNPYVDSWSWDFGDTGTDTVKDPLHIYTDTGSYNVSVTVSHNGCVKTAEKTVYIQYPLNVSELKDKEPGFKLYPNPTSNTLFIEITPAYAKAMAADGLRVIDIKGNEVFSMSLQKEKEKYSIDISGLRKGVYFLKIGDESQRFVKN